MANLEKEIEKLKKEKKAAVDLIYNLYGMGMLEETPYQKEAEKLLKRLGENI